jgi:hypothetical protein
VVRRRLELALFLLSRADRRNGTDGIITPTSLTPVGLAGFEPATPCPPVISIGFTDVRLCRITP